VDASRLIGAVFEYDQKNIEALRHEQEAAALAKAPNTEQQIKPIPSFRPRPSAEILYDGLDEIIGGQESILDSFFDASSQEKTLRRGVRQNVSFPEEQPEWSPTVKGEGPGRDERLEGVARIAAMLAEEKRKLQKQARLLRMREMDLLLREQELYRMASDVDVALSKTTASSTLSSAGRASIQAARVLESEVDALIANPNKVRFLFSKIDEAKLGFVTKEQFISVYRRSPALRLVGFSPDEETAMLERVIPERMDIDEFGMVLMKFLQE
jgi:hypothetical protein